MIKVNAPLAIALKNIAIFPPRNDLILNNDRSIIGLITFVSTNTNNPIRNNPTTINKYIPYGMLLRIWKEPKVIPTKIRNNPVAKVALPIQSIFSFLIVPNSRSFVRDQIIANNPIGIFIQNIDLHPRYVVRNPPNISPITDPTTIDI